MTTPRKRLVIEDSSSSEGSFFLDEDAESTSSSDDESVRVVNKKTTSGIQDILEPMKKITLSTNAPSRKEESEQEVLLVDSDDDDTVEIETETPEKQPPPKPRSSSKFQRLDSLNFDSDSSDSRSDSDSDSSFEIPPPAFPSRKTDKFKDDNCIQATPSDDDDDEDSFQSAKEELSCSSDDNDGELDETGRWKHDKIRKEVSLFSSSEFKMPKLVIPTKLFKTLFDYQKVGVAWMAGLHHGKIGGLLGDDMGLGKTYQVCAFLGGMMKAQTIRNALVVAPVSVLRSWEREANKVAKACVPNLRIQVVSSALSKSVRTRRLQEAQEWYDLSL